MIIALGGGGHFRALKAVIDRINGYSISLGGSMDVDTIIPDTRELLESHWRDLAVSGQDFLLSIGQVHTAAPRRTAYEKVKKYGGSFITVISPDAFVANTAKIGEGTVLMHHANVNSFAKIGLCGIINTGATVEHDVSIGDFVHISTGAVINGQCRIGHDCFIGSNAVVLNEISVITGTLVGAGSVVVKDITKPGVYVGNPAVFIKENTCTPSFRLSSEDLQNLAETMRHL